jgi:hypothetical protein
MPRRTRAWYRGWNIAAGRERADRAEELVEGDVLQE